VINADYFPLKKALLQNAILGKRIRLIEGHLSSDDMTGLTVCCDCFVSLHRSEGLGMGMAKAMYLGKPVIATGYSGNMDFMNGENSFLVKYDLVEIIEDDGPYKRGNVWADPDIDHAAQLMQLVYNNRGLSESKSRQAAQDIKNFMNPKITGIEMMKRLKTIAGDQ
jgi:glycosyltransferase involved in cell wall biosynthesis